MADDRDYIRAVPVVIIWVAVMALYWYFQKPDWITNTLAWLGSAGLVGLTIMMVTWRSDDEKKKSMLWGLKPLIDRWPAVAKPEGHVHFKTKMLWFTVVLVMYFIMTNVAIYGLDQKSIDVFSDFRAIMAGASGSLMHLGIGPIVTGSIIMQLFTGAKIINLDIKNEPEHKAIYQGVQKILVVVMIFVEAIPQTYGYLVPAGTLVDQYGDSVARLIIIAQLFAGSYLVFLMDEVVSKWGIGSGISMFIAAGVAQAIFTGTFNWYPSKNSVYLAERLGMTGSVADNCPSGTLPKTIYILNNISARDLTSRGYEAIFLQPPNPIIALLGTLFIFFVVAYAESMKVELPLAHERARGARGRYPIRLIYTSNIPVILMSALLANVNMFALLFWSHPNMKTWPILGHNDWLGKYEPGQTTPSMGLAWYMSRPKGVYEWLLPLLNPDRYGVYMSGHEYWQVLIHVLVYLGAMIGGSILFAKFWVETTDMGPEAIARQIEGSGMQIPGFRRDPRVLRKVLDRYIPVVTVISGAFVGSLAALADMIGTVGNTSGTGVLLTVGILIQFYEAMGREQMIEMHPVLRGFFGEE